MIVLTHTHNGPFHHNRRIKIHPRTLIQHNPAPHPWFMKDDWISNQKTLFLIKEILGKRIKWNQTFLCALHSSIQLCVSIDYIYCECNMGIVMVMMIALTFSFHLGIYSFIETLSQLSIEYRKPKHTHKKKERRKTPFSYIKCQVPMLCLSISIEIDIPMERAKVLLKY